MRRTDSFLIDRVFQPVVDALASLVSCYALAAFFLTGAGLCFAASLIHEEHWLSLACVGIWLPIHIVRAHRLDQERPRAVLSDERVTGFVARMWFLCLQVASAPLFVLILRAQGVWFLLEGAAWWMVVAGLYLMACRRPPPSEQPARRAWFGWLNPLATSAGVR